MKLTFSFIDIAVYSPFIAPHAHSFLNEEAIVDAFNFAIFINNLPILKVLLTFYHHE